MRRERATGPSAAPNGCQREIAKAIRAKGADYLLALKASWPALAEEVRLFFEREPAAAFDTHITPMAITGASRSGATPSPTTSAGSQPAVAFPAWLRSAWSRPRSSAAAS